MSGLEDQCMPDFPLTLDEILASSFYPHLFDAGEEGGRFDAKEFRCSAGAVDFPACFVQRDFNVRLFPQANVLFGQNLAGVAAIFLDGPRKSFHEILKVICLSGSLPVEGRLPPGPMDERSYYL